ncbi:MAG: hypothetical protein Q8K86_08550 [Candidatus Nanopelagicaceae bacterium]|nr:hypothetical protein [Candidatus Nanopelagicaceae bacterium]
MKLDNLHNLQRCLNLFEDKQSLIAELDALAKSLGIPAMVIGGAALPTYNFVRLTEDVDLITTVDDAHKLGDALLKTGHFQFVGHSKFKHDSGLEVNFCPEGVRTHQSSIKTFPSTEDKTPGLHVVSLPRLLAMKVEARRMRDRGDVVELVKRNGLTRQWMEENVLPLLTGMGGKLAMDLWKEAQKEKENAAR